MAELGATLDWVAQADISDIMADLGNARHESIIAVGSGGSLSAAHHLARLQRHFHHRLGAAMTPYEFQSDPIVAGTHFWIFSAGGSNVDVIAAVTAANRAELATVNAVTIRRRSALSRLADGNRSIRLHHLAIPSKKDGFLATNSLFAFCCVMTRAYMELNGDTEGWQRIVAQLSHYIDGERRNTWRGSSLKVSGIRHLVVLHDADTSLGAFDLESKLTEAGIVGVQMADYRHFAHGRHHWLAKNGHNSGVLTLSSASERSLALRTTKLLPAEIPIATIDLPDRGELAQLTSLLAAFYVTEELSLARGVDPGQPGVPEFGRKLYGLRMGKAVTRTHQQVAVDRKRSEQLTHSYPGAGQMSLDALVTAHGLFEEHLAATPLGGIVLDYDGTLVDASDRFKPPRAALVTEMLRLLHDGLPIGIATGRGRSAGTDLRSVLPEKLWSRVTLGYYNGAVIRDLADADPLESEGQSEELVLVHDRLQLRDRRLRLSLRQHQLTVEAYGGTPEDRLWERVRALVDELQLPLLRVLRSSHSVDVVDPSASKLNVVHAVAAQARTPAVLRIGDRGRWPGNDFELLASPLGLSVDQVSPDPAQCWNLAPEGLRGSAATLYYLRSVGMVDGLGSLRLDEA